MERERVIDCGKTTFICEELLWLLRWVTDVELSWVPTENVNIHFWLGVLWEGLKRIQFRLIIIARKHESSLMISVPMSLTMASSSKLLGCPNHSSSVMSAKGCRLRQGKKINCSKMDAFIVIISVLPSLWRSHFKNIFDFFSSFSLTILGMRCPFRKYTIMALHRLIFFTIFKLLRLL